MARSAAASGASSALGWLYFVSWSVSFYPQAVLNYRRKSVVGMSFDFQTLNLLGYSCYSMYTCCLYFDAAVRDEYADAFGGSSSLVTVQDCFFALHACALTACQCAQILAYERGGQRVARATIAAIGAAVGTSATFAAIVALRAAPAVAVGGGVRLFSWLAWLYWLSLIKLGVTVSKYVPQALSNYRRKSTVGWSIGNVLLDFAGGFLSIAQLILDGATKGWSGVVGDPVKFALGFVSIVFDILFIVQHYVLYTDRGAKTTVTAAAGAEPPALTFEGSGAEGGDIDARLLPPGESSVQ